MSMMVVPSGPSLPAKNALQGINRTVHMEDEDDECESYAKAHPTVKISDVHLSALVIHLGEVKLEGATLGSLRDHTPELYTHASTCVVGRHEFIV